MINNKRVLTPNLHNINTNCMVSQRLNCACCFFLILTKSEKFIILVCCLLSMKTYRKMKSENDNVRWPRIDRSKKKLNKKPEDSIDKQELKEFKKQKQRLTEEEEDWQNWREYYNT